MARKKKPGDEPLLNHIYPKRFVDRPDCAQIIKAASNFSRRGHSHIPNWMIMIFVITQFVFIGMMLYFAMLILKTQQQKSEISYILQYMLICFVIVTTYSVFLVNRLKNVLSATEFMSLFLSKSLESYANCYCIMNRQGKIIFYNDSFARSFMKSDEVETKPYTEILNDEFFDAKHLDKIKDTINNAKENSFSFVTTTNTSQTMRNVRIVPLSRPDGIFVMKVITVEIVKNKNRAAG